MDLRGLELVEEDAVRKGVRRVRIPEALLLVPLEQTLAIQAEPLQMRFLSARQPVRGC